MTNYNDLLANLGKKKNDIPEDTPILKSSAKNKNDFLKNWIDIKKLNIDWFGVFISFLRVFLIAVLVYSYNTDVYGKIQNLPTQERNISILKQNIEKQKQELEVLNNLTINDEELKIKEKILSKNIFSEDNYTAMNQIYALYSIAKDIWIKIESVQKITDKIDQNKVNQYWDFLDWLWISNFYEKSWYNKYILTTTSDEETILKFKEIIDNSVPFVFESYTINENQETLQYSISIKSFYSINNF